ncbi:hypothetical protein BH18ACT2_BH18ACT2_22200 [soil metagenome]
MNDVLDDDRIDQRLRRAGERLRHDGLRGSMVEAALEHLSDRPPERRDRRRLAPTVLGAVAVMLAVLVLVRQDEPIEVAPTATAAPAIERVADDFDGDGGGCTAIFSSASELLAQGCLSGAQLRSERTFIAMADDELMPVAPSPPGRCALAGQEGRIVDVVACDPGRELYGLVPTEPWGTAEWFVTDRTGAEVRLQPLDLDGDVLVFDVPGAADRPCLVVASAAGDGEWSDACTAVRTIRALTAVGGRVAVIGPLATSVEPADVDLIERLDCVDLLGLLRRADIRGGVTIQLRCVGDLAVVVQGWAELELGRAGPLGLLLERQDGRWVVVDEGATLPCAPTRFCEVFGPTDDLTMAADPIPRP